MKRTITIMAFALGIFTVKAQTLVADFESLPLATNSAYSSTMSAPFATAGASFQYIWDTGFSYWSGGFSYTNKYDSSAIVTATPGLYGVKPYKGYNNSNIYTVGQDQGIINLTAPSNTVSGFYITNTTYAYRSMKHGDQFAKKFGGTSGNDPDFLKVTVKGYKAGVMLQDSVPFYLADYRFANNAQDYLVSTWQWVNTSTLGNVDSLQFFMYTSDIGSFGPNTPLFFGIDNFTTIQSSVGLTVNTKNLNASVYPNPFKNSINISFGTAINAEAAITDVTGKMVHSQHLTEMQNTVDLNELQNGIYFLELTAADKRSVIKLIKN